jgi:hypothetical protein
MVAEIQTDLSMYSLWFSVVLAAMYFMMNLEASVLPEPDSPEISTHVSRPWKHEGMSYTYRGDREPLILVQLKY